MKPLACIFLIISISFSSLPAFAYTEEDCVACHATDRGKSQKKIDLASFKASVHPQNNLSCQDCHTRVLDKTHETAPGQDPVDCSQCHSRESGPVDALSFLSTIKISTHEKQDFSFACQRDNCIGCHQGQAIHRLEEPTGNQNCRVCHFDPEGKSALLGIIHLITGSDRKPVLALFDITFIIAALITLGIGISRLRTLKASQRKETLRGDFAGLIRYLAGHKKIMGKPVTGTLHFIIFWGCLFFILMIIPAQLGMMFPKPIANGISLVMDITGFLMLAAILHFLVNLFHTDKAKRVPGKFILLFLLLIIVLTGFFSAGSRLKIIQEGFSMVSPIGSVFSVMSPDSPLFMQAMIRLHFSGVLIFFALIPFSFFRHIPAGLRNVYSKQGLNPGELCPVDWDASPLGAKTISDLPSKQLLGAQACVSCRRCEDNCPATISHKPLNPRQIMASLFHRMTQDAAFFNRQWPARDLEQDISGDEIWACTTCTACATHCPMLINPMDIIMVLRRHQVLDKGFVPHEARHSIRNLELFGDPFGKGVSCRTDWRIGLNIPSVRELPEKPKILLWVGCSGAFHPRYGNVARDMARILETAGISFAIPGKDELCCGDGARRLGEEALFQNLARRNIETLQSYGIKDILVFCPHCYNTLKNEYPAFGGTFNVIPAVEYILMLIDQKKIIPAYPIHKEMTLHDPCYLGRVNGIYKPLRKLIERIPGLTLKELNRSFDTALCCGGGGGRMWLHETIGEKINHLRAGEIVESGVDLLGTACPFCMTMMEDGMGAVSAENELKTLDLIEITAQSIGITDKGKS